MKGVNTCMPEVHHYLEGLFPRKLDLPTMEGGDQLNRLLECSHNQRIECLGKMTIGKFRRECSL